MQYNVKRACWGKIESYTIELPDNIELVTGGPHDIGQCLNDGFLHYMAVMKASDYNKCKKLFDKIFIYVHKLGDLRFICFHNIQFVGDSPKIITEEELNQKWDFKKYYIMTWSDDFRLIGMNKIDYVHSEFNVDCLLVENSSYIGNAPVDRITYLRGVSLDGLLLSCHDIIRIFKGGKCKEYWDTLLSNVLKKFNVKHHSKNVDVNAAYNMAVKAKDDYANMMANAPHDGIPFMPFYGLTNEVCDVIDMKKVIYKND